MPSVSVRRFHELEPADRALPGCFANAVHRDHEVHPPGLHEEVDPLQADLRAQAAHRLHLLEELRVRAVPVAVPQ